MFRIETHGFFIRRKRLYSDSKLTADDFAMIARALGTAPLEARKIALVAARQAAAPEHIVTLWNGKESEAMAAPGDFVVTYLDRGGQQALRDDDGHCNTYVIAKDRFPELYERGRGTSEWGDVYRPRSRIRALRLGAGFDILAPWGERQTSAEGYLAENGGEIYGIAGQIFEDSYVVE